jgi:hypothetical protein
MSPVVVLLLGLVIVYAAASGRWQDIWNALTKKK